MRYLAILISVLMLAACGNGKLKQAMYADCRLQGYEQGTQPFNDCVTLAMHNARMQYYMATQGGTASSLQNLGTTMMIQGAQPAQPAPMPMPQPVAPKTTFCYPGQGFTYCQ